MITGNGNPLREGGWNLLELMVAISIVAVGLLVMLQQLTISFREAEANENRAFAYQKAAAVLEEIQNAIDRGEIEHAGELEALADPAYNPVLTTRTDAEGLALPAAHPMSGNSLRQGQWLWSRRIEVEPHEKPGLFYVKVNVYRFDDGAWVFEANQSQLMSLLPDASAPVKVFDVYLLALGEVPSLWRDLAGLRALMEDVRLQVESDCTARFRYHWITRLGYGRDPAYAPYVNAAVPAGDAAPYVYWYPGVQGQGEPGPDLYHSELLQGRHRIESGPVNDYDLADNPIPHAVADAFNHCLRLPEAEALFEARVAAGLEKADEPPLQVLLARLLADPQAFRNAIFVNLHGSGMPMPPMRNYSDAAKDPAGHPGVRVVTHPARLRTPLDPDGNGNHDDTLDLELRVYAYKTDPLSGPAVLDEPILVQIQAPVDLSARINDSANPTLWVHRLIGGVNRDTGQASGDGRSYRGFDTADGLAPASPAKPYDPYYQAGFTAGPEPYTWIALYHTPLVAPPVGDEGLGPGAWLYGMEYVPSPVVATGFDRDLADEADANTPKNTARWRIRIPKSLLAPGLLGSSDLAVRVVTRIGTDTTTGTMWPAANEPHNLSATWAYWASSPEFVPALERYQLLGDPRHNPYLDLCAGSDGLANGYNWHFDDLRAVQDATGSWPCLDPARLQDGFGAGATLDAPRYLQLWRQALQASGALWVNPTGEVARALLRGGEIGQPGNAAGIDLAPVTVAGAFLGLPGAVAIDTVMPVASAPGVMAGEQVVLANGGGGFWCKPWLGELFPDAEYATWIASGNLPTGSGPGTFRRAQRHLATLPDLPPGTAFGPTGALLGAAGSVAALDTGSLASTYLHDAEEPPATADLAAALIEIATATNEPVLAALPTGRPFALGQAFPGALPYFAFTDSYPKHQAQLLESYYSFGAYRTASGLLASTEPTGTATAFLIAMGLSPSTPQEDEEVARQVLLSGLRAFHRAGLPAQTGRVVQQPRLEILEPRANQVLTDPAAILLRWQTPFVRFDGAAYTESHPIEFGEQEADLMYSILVSRDEGATWSYALNGQPADPGVRPTDTALQVLDAGEGVESFSLPTPETSFPGSHYLLRVECYHRQRQAHYAWHEVRILLRRSSK